MARRGLAQDAEIPPGVAGAVGYRSVGVAKTSPPRKRAKKNRARPGFFLDAALLRQELAHPDRRRPAPIQST